ncbi:hypothetical protein FKW77_007532 [Venturia effusa]|uniref:Large ribosomal subunit protein bL17m n=1 Tax=Venturia effusa TaxID=50376 RepID=A0A517LLT9_9PEZI|nr:hypothetical protein FKW77_007532 [Venturia effusa]
MAGGHANFRGLSRKSSHRQALLRNLVESLIEHESIQTTWHKAKEAQRLAEKVITLGKKNTEASKRKATSIFFRPSVLLPKLFGTLATRYAERPGGYTRVLRIEPIKEDQAASAILELVDGPKDIRWAMTARTIAAERRQGKPTREITQRNIDKVTRYREHGIEELEQLASRFEEDVVPELEERVVRVPPKKRVYPLARHLSEKPKNAVWKRN